MNKQPFQTPPRRWESRLNPLWVRILKPWRSRTLRKNQRITNVQVLGLERVKALLEKNAGVLITPNHSFHYDSYVLFEATDRLGVPAHVLTAWQVFAMSSWFDCWALQRHGCFSIDREGIDLHAFKTAVDILKRQRYPLVIFPEGDIYHLNDRVTPFREGAASIALSAAKRAERDIYIVPTAIKVWYVSDPVASMLQVMSALERRLFWQPRPDLTLTERILRFSGAMLSLKEIEFLGQPQTGRMRERARSLSEFLLSRQEQRLGLTKPATLVPERVKNLRKQHIERLGAADITPADRGQIEREMEELFFIVQLFSYPGDYIELQPTLERLSETLDKFEEDVLESVYPSVRGERHAAVEFGEPILVPRQSDRDAAVQYTNQAEAAVQSLLDGLGRRAAADRAAKDAGQKPPRGLPRFNTPRRTRACCPCAMFRNRLDRKSCSNRRR